MSTPTPYDAFVLAKQVRDALKRLYESYGPCYNEAYYSDLRGFDPTYNAYINEGSTKKREACRSAHDALNRSLTLLRSAQHAVDRAWREPTSSRLCRHCMDRPGLSRLGGLCQADYQYARRNGGVLPPTHILDKRKNRKEGER